MTAPAPPSQPIYILPLGDSITQGGREGRPEYSYRYPLYYLLRDSGYNVKFVGSLQTGIDEDFTWPDQNGVPFDPAHEGHYGWHTAHARDHLPEWMEHWHTAPDIALVHLGTNDRRAPDYQKYLLQPLRDIVAMLREKNPRIVALIGHLNFNQGEALAIRPLMEDLAANLSTPISPVVTVAHYSDWNEKTGEPDSDTFDWLHPNPQGQHKMAQKWLNTVKPFLNQLRTERDKAALK